MNYLHQPIQGLLLKTTQLFSGRVKWQADYNTERPHKSLGYLAPVKFAEQHYKSRESLQQLYPQTANVNTLQIEESCLVDKIF